MKGTAYGKCTAAAVAALCAVLCGCESSSMTRSHVPRMTTQAPAAETAEETTTGTAAQNEEKAMISFTKVSYEEFREATADEMYAGDWVYGTDANDERYALFYGKMRARFGEPNDLSDDWENMYSYFIKADNGVENLYFMVYHGAGGSSIAMPVDAKNGRHAGYDAARNELLSYVESADPADYTWEGVYYDVPVSITYSVQDGKPSVEYGGDMGPGDFPDMEL